MKFLKRVKKKTNCCGKFFVPTLIAIVVLIVLIIFSWQGKGLGEITANLIGVSEKAVLKISPASGTFKIDETFSVNVSLDTKGKNVVAVAAFLSYNPEFFEVLSINTANSDFNLNNGCIYQSKPCEIIKHDKTTGKIEIVQGKPTPGVNKSGCLIASLTIKAKKEISPSSDNFIFDFQGSYNGKSRAIFDDGKGTDILSGVENAKYVIEKVETSTTTPPIIEPTSTPPITTLPSDIAPPLISGFSISEINSTSAKISWKTNEAATSKVYYMKSLELTTREAEQTGFIINHLINLSNLSPSSIYYLIIESEDNFGNISQYSQQSFVTLSGNGTVLPEEPVEPGQEGPETPSESGITEQERQQKITELKTQINRIVSAIALLQTELAKILSQGTAKPVVVQRPITEESIPAAFKFENNLLPGQSGLEVRYLQIFLYQQGASIYPEGLITGYFGNATKNAVIRFQERYWEDILAPWKLTKGTGSVTRTTRMKLNELLGY